MADPQLRPCANDRCRRMVFDAQILKARGAPVAVVLDGEASTWQEGARLKLLPHGATPLVKKLTASTIHEAFAVTALYVEHREVCEAEARRTKAKKTEGHA